MEPVHKHWRQGRFKRKRGNAETFNLFINFMVSKVFNELQCLHCLYCPSVPSTSFSAEGRTMSFASLLYVEIVLLYVENQTNIRTTSTYKELCSEHCSEQLL